MIGHRLLGFHLLERFPSFSIRRCRSLAFKWVREFGDRANTNSVYRECFRTNYFGGRTFFETKYADLCKRLQAQVAHLPQAQQDTFFMPLVMRNAKYVAVRKRDKDALRIRLGMPVSSPSPVNTGRLAQVAADTVVRATKKVANKKGSKQNPRRVAARREAGFFSDGDQLFHRSELSSTAKRGMLPVLDLDPVRRSADATRPVPMLRNQAHEAHQAGMAEQIRENETVSVFACANPAGSRRSTLVEPLEVPSI